MTGPARTLVGLRMGGRSLDVAVPPGLALYEVLRSAEVDLDDPGLTVVDSAGRQVDLYATHGAELVDGAVLHVLTRTSAPTRGRRDGRRPDPVADRPDVPWWLALVVAAAVVTVGAVAVGPVGTWALTGTERWAVGAVLLLAALALAVRSGAGAGVWSTLATAGAGGAAGAVTVDPAAPAAGRLLVVSALVGATVAAAARWALARRLRSEAADVAGPLAVVLGGAGLATAGTLLGDLPAALGAAVLLGAVPLTLRALPSLAVDVPDEQLVDVTQVARTVAAVRAPVRRPLGPVSSRAVRRTVRSAERRRDTGTVLLAVLAPVAGAGLLLTAPAGAVERWSAGTACVLVALALTLQPRSTRGALVRWAPRLGAGGLVLGLGATAPGLAGPEVLAGALLAAGLGAAALSLALGRGWRSIGLSRAGDLLESLTTAFALPVALAGAGAVEVVRLLTST